MRLIGVSSLRHALTTEPLPSQSPSSSLIDIPAGMGIASPLREIVLNDELLCCELLIFRDRRLDELLRDTPLPLLLLSCWLLLLLLPRLELLELLAGSAFGLCLPRDEDLVLRLCLREPCSRSRLL